MDDIIDKAWSCFQRIVPEKKPPDRPAYTNSFCKTLENKLSQQNFFKSKLIF